MPPIVAGSCPRPTRLWLTAARGRSRPCRSPSTTNTLDTQTLPHEGLIASFTHEYAGLGGESQFYKINGKARGYYTLSDEMDLVGSLAASAGYMMGWAARTTCTSSTSTRSAPTSCAALPTTASARG